MVGKKNGAVYTTPLTFKISEDEKKALRILAAREGVSLKGFLYLLLDSLFPNWRDEAKKK
jgi:hypothetical protein